MPVTELKESARKDYYAEIAEQNLAPLWERLRGLVPNEPKPKALPAGWRYADIRPILMKAGHLLTTEEAERRVLMIENPGLVGQSKITGSLFAGLQLLMPGETAESHRHSAAALRFIIEGDCAYTSVDGERTMMKPGDFVLTPSWTWHDHGNTGKDPVVWLDGLDLPTVNFFDAGFYEHYDQPMFPLSQPAGDCELRYAGTLMPEATGPAGQNSPLLNYRYEKARETLAALARNTAPDTYHGIKLHYTNPRTGGSAMPTIGAAIQLLPAGFETGAYRSTDGTVYVAVEGRGRSKIGDFTFDWGPRDIFVAPSWSSLTHQASEDAVLFSFSDRAAQERLGIWRERKGQD